MNRVLMSKSPALTKVRNNKSRRVLQVLQVSASDKDLLVSPNLMSVNGKKSEKSQKKTENFQDEVLSKENTSVVPTVRRSKRKNAVPQEQPKKTTSKEEAKASSNKVSKVTKSKKPSTRKNKKQNSSDPKQSKMDSFIANSSTSNTIFESNLENDGSSVDNDASLQDSKDSGIGISLNMLTSDNPPEIYWKMLAEERRVALEEVLYENEQLSDQLQVLQTENSQLKSCLKEAEKMATLLRQALE